MIHVLKSLLRQLLFWMIFFSVGRMLFIVYYFSLFNKAGVSVLGALVYNNLLLDISAICYIIAFPSLLVIVQLFIKSSIINKVSLYYSYMLICVVSLIVVSEIGVYSEWKTKLTYKAVAYIANPSEIYNSAGSSGFFTLMFMLFSYVLASLFVFKKIIFKPNFENQISIFKKIIIAVIIPLLIFAGMRGIKQIPINQSQSYYSKNNDLNLLSVNPFWNFIHSVFQNFSSLKQNPFLYFDKVEAETIVNKMHDIPNENDIELFKVKKPNIIFVILEGWSADLIEALGGKPGITPRFDTLIKNGYLFTRIYSPGSRSEQGMASLFSAFPSHPLTTIAHIPDKFVKLQSFPMLLGNNGYHNSFFFGGQLIYGNMRSYIYFNKFDKIIEGADFSNSIPKGKLGVHDEFLYPKVINEMSGVKEPFFFAIFTNSTHSPYDYPGKKDFLKFGDPERDYVNAAYYADSCLATFISTCSKYQWYDSTLFVFVADHGHSSYVSRSVYEPGYQHIPLLLYGHALNEDYKGKVDSTIGSQIDIAATILNQLGIESKSFFWSKDLLNPANPQFAFISYEVGFTWVCKEGYITYDHNQKKVLLNTLPLTLQDSALIKGKAYLQHLYQQYWDY